MGRKITIGGNKKNKIEREQFYFYSSFLKNRVGAPENQKIKKVRPMIIFVGLLSDRIKYFVSQNEISLVLTNRPALFVKTA